MDKIKKILVGLDMPDISTHLITYAGFIAETLNANELIFTHIYHKPDFPEEVTRVLREQGQEPENRIEEEMQEAVNKHLGSQDNRKVSFVVASGSKLTTFLSVVKDADADLILLARKNEDGSGLLLSRAARMAPCSVMIVPENTEPRFDSVMICSDFSECSAMAFEQSLQFSKNNPHITTYLHHVYQVPTGYHVSGKSFTDFANIMKQHSVNKCKSFLKSAKIDSNSIVPVFTVDRRGNPALVVKEAADSMKVSLMIVGSKGRTFAASIFLGSFAEKLVRLQKNSPLLIVKKKNAIMGILDALRVL